MSNPGVAGLQFMCGAPGPAGGLCWEQSLLTLYQNGANGTFIVGYDVAVPAGAASMLVEAGTTAAQTCTDAACVPDVDVIVYDPSGGPTVIASAAAFESGVIEAPTAGTWTVLLVYFAGPPNQDVTAHVVVS
jgi:hypothetical protein